MASISLLVIDAFKFLKAGNTAFKALIITMRQLKTNKSINMRSSSLNSCQNLPLTNVGKYMTRLKRLLKPTTANLNDDVFELIGCNV